MAAVVANDVDGDGAMTKEDIFGLSSEAIGMPVVGACGVYYSGKDSDDMPVLTVDAERAASAIEKIVPLFRNKDIALYSADFASGYTNVFRQLIVQKFIEDEVLFVNNWLCVALELRSMDSDFGILPPPKLNEQQEDYMVYHSGSWTYYALVPVTIQDPDMVGHVVDALGHFGHDLVYTALVDTTITSKTLRDTDTEDMLQIIYDNRIFDAVTTYDWGGIVSLFGSFISGNTTDFASKYAASEAKIITAMNEAASTLAG